MSENQTPQTPDARRKRLTLLAGASLLLAVGYGLYWLLVARYEVDTDNAYVQGNVVQITPQIGGTVVGIDADDTDTVAPGQLLVRLDPTDTRVALDEAAAQLAQTVRDVRALFANNNALAATVQAREAELNKARAERERLASDLKRRDGLAATGAVSGEELHHLQVAAQNAEASENAAQAGLAEAREQLAKNQAQTEGTTVESHPRVLAAAGKYREAFLAGQRAGIAAPVAGTVARRSVQVGQRIAPGTPLMALIPLDQLWVDANFKESQLANLRVGQAAVLTADVYGHRTEFHGHVAGLGAGTGAAFSLLPAQNATGNWIKVVQRVPVRIALDEAELKDHPLRVGLSMEVTVNVRDQSGPAITEAGKARPVGSTTLFDGLDKTADEKVNAIVSANLGHKVRLAAGATPAVEAKPAH